MNCDYTGSAGTAVITTDKALLFTDGRYHNQAEMELGSEWTLMRQGIFDLINVICTNYSVFCSNVTATNLTYYFMSSHLDFST